MPGRKYLATSSSKYRYSINGQEKESELNENITTALYWEYDSRIVRRWNVDPKPNMAMSPYSCFNGNPILYVDLKGDTTGHVLNEAGNPNGASFVLQKDNTNTIGFVDRQTGTPFVGPLDQYSQNIVNYANTMNNSPDKSIRDRLNEVLTGKKYINITSIGPAQGFNETKGTLTYWDITTVGPVMQNNGGNYERPGSTYNTRLDPDILLAHEWLGHGFQFSRNILQHERMDMWGNKKGFADRVEADATNIANKYAITTLRANQVTHVYIEIGRALNGQILRPAQIATLTIAQQNRLVNYRLWHQIPENYSVEDSDSMKATNYK